ncbi:hypothetical protein BDF20DRAFT_990159 [Mycotypha africana]|uniref:uncharacterized protein n=1 Tax=Mycotypha africana TaxID=64632 RepID=UPI002301054B|nr:uncharacterized protein BDF20DRAFT_990159 [Mycotypha africana]KAI8971948.1 hypothetical protein BDF20DRAFT_990159 [Mycotypha africana]
MKVRITASDRFVRTILFFYGRIFHLYIRDNIVLYLDLIKSDNFIQQIKPQYINLIYLSYYLTCGSLTLTLYILTEFNKTEMEISAEVKMIYPIRPISHNESAEVLVKGTVSQISSSLTFLYLSNRSRHRSSMMNRAVTIGFRDEKRV